MRNSIAAFAALSTLAAVSACTQNQAADLCAAIEAGDVAAARRVLSGSPVDMLRQQGTCHPAFQALTSSDVDTESRLDILEAMLKAGLDPNATLSRYGSGGVTSSTRPVSTSVATTMSLAEWASTAGVKTVRVLLVNGLDVKSVGAGRAVGRAAGFGDLASVMTLAEAGASLNEPLLDEAGAPTQTALGVAVTERHHQVIAYLGAREARFASVPVSPIFEAARKGDVDMVRQALASGADLNARDPYGQPVLLRAAGFGQWAVVEALVASKAAVDTFTMGESALQAAASEGHSDVVRMLLRAGARPNARADDQSATALLRAVHNGRIDVVSALIAGGADPNIADGGGTLPMTVAVRARNLPVVEALIRGKAKVDAIEPSSGSTWLHVAVVGCERPDFDVPLLRALAAAGVSPVAKDAEGRTARQRAEERLEGESRSFYKACYEARVAALKGLGG